MPRSIFKENLYINKSINTSLRVIYLVPMNLFDRMLDYALDKERSRQLLMFLFFLDILLTTLFTIWNPTMQGILAMFGMYLMILIPILVLYRQRHCVVEPVTGD